MNVFPIKDGAKFPPLVKGWQQAAKPLDQWGPAGGYGNGSCNWGVHCEGMVVVDVDVRNDGNASLGFLDDLYGFPPTYTVTTPSGGLHLYYRLPDGHPGVPNSASKLAPGIDIKSTGGYVLAAGSQIDGREYAAIDAPMVEAPAWLVLLLGTTVPKTRTLIIDVPDAPPEVVAQAFKWIQGRPRGDEAYATACGLRDFGLSEYQALGMLLAWDGRLDSILAPKVAHAYKYARGEPGGKIATLDDFDVIEPQPAPPRPRAKHAPQRFLELAQGDHSSRGYVVKGLLQRGSHAVLYGPPGAGKTFVALDIAYHVAAGLPWMERRVHAGPVLYLAYEGVGGLVKRAQALKKVYGDADIPLYVQAADYNLRDKTGRQALGQTIAELPEKPVLIIIDTLARAMKGGDENTAKDMGELNDAVTALIENTGACVVLVHHSGKNKANGARGSSALLGAVDTEIEVDDYQIHATKQRDVELGEPIGFGLETHMVGMDEDNEPVMSCTVAPRTIVSRINLKGQKLDAYNALRDAGKPLTMEEWKAAAKCTNKNVYNELLKPILNCTYVDYDGTYCRLHHEDLDTD